jgi:hypothetical protein
MSVYGIDIREATGVVGCPVWRERMKDSFVSFVDGLSA